MTVFNIRIQHTRPESFRDGDVGYHLRRILDADVPVVLTLSAVYDGTHRSERYHPEVLELVREIGKKTHSFIGQQGALGGPCKYKHRFTDRSHENACLYPWNKAPSKEEQKRLMRRGGDIIEELTDGIRPVFFAASNHLYNQDTVEAASELRYQYFGDRAFICFPPYRKGELVVVPESSLEKGKPLAVASHYVHYDKIDGLNLDFQAMLNQATPLSSIKPTTIASEKLIRQNHRKKIMWKLGRDIFKMPQRVFA